MGEEAIFFETPSELRAWLEEHHATASELWIGHYKKESGRPTLTWSQVVARARRLTTLIECSAEGRRVPALST